MMKQSAIRFSCNDRALEEGFLWAKSQALIFQFVGYSFIENAGKHFAE